MESDTRVSPESPFRITAKERKRMNSKLLQFWWFIVLNLKILKAVDRSKRA